MRAVERTVPIIGSVLLHVVILGGAGVVAYRSLAAKEAREAERQRAAAPSGVIALELPGVAEGTLVAGREQIPEGAVPDKTGGAAVARVDTGSAGAGGDPT